MERTDNTLKILVTVSSILFLLIAIKTSYPAENIGEMTIDIAGKFVAFELFLFLIIYVFGSMLSEAMSEIWVLGRKMKHKSLLQKNKNENKPIEINNDTNGHSMLLPAYKCTEDSQNNDNQENNMIEEPELVDKHIPAITELSEEIINYTKKTFENIMTSEQIEILLNNFRNLNNGESFKKVEWIKLPKGIFQFDLYHFCWNVGKRIYVKAICDEDFRARTAVLIKSSFPLTAKSTLFTINKTMTNDDKPFSIPIIKPENPLEPIILFGKK